MEPLAEKPTDTPKAIQARNQARVTFARTIIGGAVLLLLVVAYIISLFLRLESAGNNVLLVIAGGIGFLIREKTRDTAQNSKPQT